MLCSASSSSPPSLLANRKLPARDRSTGFGANLTSPTSETSPGNKFSDPGPKDELKGSIVGLRASKFTSGLSAGAGASPEPKPRTADPPVGVVCPPKPKPLPKPRPWSIVGVDRKSGELTSVVSDAPADQKLEVPGSAGVGRKSSVRDMIQNMNKSGGETSVASLPVTSATSGTTSDSARRKGGSLPRGVQPPASATSATSAASSPSVAKKKDSTSDDPRILKLDDDYAFDDVMDV